jgi:ELWxxDGT repeat protein
MQIKKFLASTVIGFLLLSLFSSIPITFAALNEPELLKDIAPGTQDFYPDNFVELNGNVYFTSDGEGDEGVRSKIYFQSLSDIGGDVQILGEDVDYFYPNELAVSGDILYFEADSEGFGEELWAYDGDEIYMVKDLSPGTDDTNLSMENDEGDIASLTVGEYFYFVAYSDQEGRELWVTDGTENGTYMLSNIDTDNNADIEDLIHFNDEIYFTGEKLENDEWVEAFYKVNFTDNVPVNTTRIADMSDFDENTQNYYVDELQVLGDKIYFLSSIEDCCDREIFTFDGTTISKPFEMAPNARIDELAVSNGVLYFSSSRGLEYSNGEFEEYHYDNIDEALWYYEPSNLSGPLWSVASLPNYTGTFSIFNVNDAPRPELLEDININGSANINDLTPYLNGVIFEAYTDETGSEPYFADLSGATILADLYEGTESSSIDEFFVVDFVAFFETRTEEYDEGDNEVLFATTGLTGDTRPVKINDEFLEVNAITPADNNLYFEVEIGNGLGEESGIVQVGEGYFASFLTDANTYGNGIEDSCYDNAVDFKVVSDSTAYFCANSNEIWVTDGTTGGTSLFYEADYNIERFYVHESHLYFTYYNNESGNYELVVLDSADVEAGVELVEYSENYSNFNEIVISGDIMYLSANTSSVGQELFKIDITETPTELELVSDLNEGGASSNPSNFELGEDNELFFTAEYYDVENYGVELMFSNGTAEGTTMVLDIFPGIDNSYPYELEYLNNKLFFVANDGVNGYEPWVFDGTNTYMIIDLNEGNGSSSIENFIDYNNNVVFGDYTNGSKLYFTSGTQGEATLIAESNDSYFDDFGVIGNKLFFDNYTEELGTELWVTEGTLESTQLLKDIRVGSRSGGPGDFYVVGDYLYFEANNGTTGSELFISDGTAEGTVLIEDIYPGSYPDYNEGEEVFDNTFDSSPRNFAQLGNKLLFLARNTETSFEPYVMEIDPTVTPEPETPMPEAPRSGGGSGSKSSTRSNSETAGSSYAEEVQKVLTEKVVTDNPDGLTNKCEALVMMERVFEWKVPVATGTKYSDVPEWCTNVAAFGTARGIVEGRDVDRLGMETPVTRDEVSLMIYRELKLQKYEFKGTNVVEFTDSPLTPWAKEAIEALAKESIIKGFAEGSFGGRKNILKQDLGVMLLRLK